MKKYTLTLLMLIVGLPALAQTEADTEAVRRAALDYIEAFYNGETDKLIRSVHSDVDKYGYFVKRGETTYSGEPMSYQEMLDYAEAVKEKGRKPRADAPKEVEVLDVQDQTAAVKIRAWWGTDYMLLAKYDGTWKIRQVLWQSDPPK